MQDLLLMDQFISVLIRAMKEHMEKRSAGIHTSPVELYKILKFEAVAASGGEAKFMITGGHVKVNQRIETRKRKKIYPGDTIETGNLILEIRLQENGSPA